MQPSAGRSPAVLDVTWTGRTEVQPDRARRRRSAPTSPFADAVVDDDAQLLPPALPRQRAVVAGGGVAVQRAVARQRQRAVLQRVRQRESVGSLHFTVEGRRVRTRRVAATQPTGIRHRTLERQKDDRRLREPFYLSVWLEMHAVKMPKFPCFRVEVEPAVRM